MNINEYFDLKIIAYDQADNSRSLYGVKLKAPELIKADFDGDILNVIEYNFLFLVSFGFVIL